jgi:hypothetical protein
METAQQQKQNSHQVKSGSKHIQTDLMFFLLQELTRGS